LSERLSVEAIAVLAILFGLPVYAIVRNYLTEGWLASLTSVDDASGGMRR